MNNLPKWLLSSSQILLPKYSPLSLSHIGTKSYPLVSTLGFLSIISQDKCFPKLFGPSQICIYREFRAGYSQLNTSTIQYQRTPISIFQCMVCVWNSFLWEVTESNTMTEKGTVIHDAASKCEPRLQGQSNLMLQKENDHS